LANPFEYPPVREFKTHDKLASTNFLAGPDFSSLPTIPAIDPERPK